MSNLEGKNNTCVSDQLKDPIPKLTARNSCKIGHRKTYQLMRCVRLRVGNTLMKTDEKVVSVNKARKSHIYSTERLFIFCIIAARKAIFLDSMTQVRINTVISVEKTAGSWRKRVWDVGEGIFELRMVLLMSQAVQSGDHLLVPFIWTTVPFKYISAFSVFDIDDL